MPVNTVLVSTIEDRADLIKCLQKSGTGTTVSPLHNVHYLHVYTGLMITKLDCFSHIKYAGERERERERGGGGEGKKRVCVYLSRLIGFLTFAVLRYPMRSFCLALSLSSSLPSPFLSSFPPTLSSAGTVYSLSISVVGATLSAVPTSVPLRAA